MKMPPWSYSSLTAFETCPRRYHITRVSKSVQEPQTEATIWGNRVHQALEDRVIKKTPLPEGMQQWERIAARFDTPKGTVFTETKMALNENLQPCKWNDTNCYVRGIIDLGVDAGERATLLDWKTGKVKHDIDQLKLFTGLYMQSKPYVEEVRTGFIWLAHNKLTREDFTRSDLPKIWEDFFKRANKMNAAYENNKWGPNPSGLCNGWCPVGAHNCEYWKPKRF